jgi:hypothetical protein
MRLNGIDVIRRIIDHPEIFPISNDMDEVARKLVIKRLKTTRISLDEVKSICSALGVQNFKMLADGLSDRDAKAIVSKIDKENKEAKLADGPLQRVLLIELATGRAEPLKAIIKRAAAGKPKGRGKSEADAIEQALSSRAMQATRKR